jgi:hypothetical protein
MIFINIKKWPIIWKYLDLLKNNKIYVSIKHTHHYKLTFEKFLKFYFKIKNYYLYAQEET